MGRGITWYDILGVLPGASAEDIQLEYGAKTSLLRPELISGASSKVITAASRAQGILDAAVRVLGDPVNRKRYDEMEGFRPSGGGLDQPEDLPSEPGFGPSDVSLPIGAAGAEVLGGLMALADWLTPRPRQPGRIPVPDVRGLFYAVCLEVTGRLGLQVTAVRLTEHPMPVDGLVVDQSPLPAAKLRRGGTLTVQVWHPPAGT
jgi:PASTA domain